ncbi:MAG: UvrD-helicase domain-containing protein, partial [Clostridia bacterium]|nr:UvrD-helicase domain-containing protein [Clostridia bacterium]
MPANIANCSPPADSVGKEERNMSPKWTASQQQALEIRGTNLLVSAGAGSGKTTVLTHRILERIKNGDSIGDFLVVTF